MIDNATDELWFESAMPFNAEQGNPTNVFIRWKTDNVNRSGRDPVSRRVPIRVRLDLSASTTVRNIDTRTLSSLFNGPQDVTTSTLYWNFVLERWVVNGDLQSGSRGNPVNGTMSIDAIRGGEEGEWQDAEFTVDAFDTFSGFFEETDLPDATLTVEFYYPQSTRNGRKVATANGSNNFRTFIDLIRVTNQFEEDDTDPVYEHVAFTTAARDEVVATRTESYDPGFISSGVETFRQFLSSTSYWRRAETSADATTIEEKVTLQKLNDFSDRFQYFEGSILNRNTVPLQMHNKVLINYSSSPQTTSCVLNGGEFSPKFNAWDTFMYFPNQSRDISFGRYYTHNVELIGRLFEGRSVQGTYVVGIDLRGLDDMGAQNQTTDDMGRNPGDAGYVATNNSITTTQPYIIATGIPGQKVEGVLTLSPGVGFDVSASNMTILDENAAVFVADTELQYIEFGDIADSGVNIGIPYVITIPQRAEYEGVVIQGEVDPFIGGNNRVDLTLALAAGGASGVTIANTMRPFIAPQGSVIPVQVFISPAAGMQLSNAGLAAPTRAVTTTGSTVAGNTVVSGGAFSTLGQNLVWEGTVTIPADADTDITVTFNIPAANQTAIPTTPTGVSSSTVSIDFNETLTNVSLGIADLTGSNALVGVVGTTQQLNIPVYPASGYQLDFDNFSITSGNTNLVSMLPDPTSEDVGPSLGGITIPVLVKFPAGGGSVTVTISGSAQEIGADVYNYTIQVNKTGTDSSNVTIVETSETLSLGAGQSQLWQTYITGNAGYNLSASDITVTGSGWAIADVGTDSVRLWKTVSINETNPAAVSDTVSSSYWCFNKRALWFRF